MKVFFTILLGEALVLSLVIVAAGQTRTVNYDHGTLRWKILDQGPPIEQFIVQCGDQHARYNFPRVRVPFVEFEVPIAKIVPESMIGKTAYCTVTSRTRAGLETQSEEIVFVATHVPSAPEGLTVK